GSADNPESRLRRRLLRALLEVTRRAPHHHLPRPPRALLHSDRQHVAVLDPQVVANFLGNRDPATNADADVAVIERSEERHGASWGNKSARLRAARPATVLRVPHPTPLTAPRQAEAGFRRGRRPKRQPSGAAGRVGARRAGPDGAGAAGAPSRGLRSAEDLAELGVAHGAPGVVGVGGREVEPGDALELARLVLADEDHLSVLLAAAVRPGADAPDPGPAARIAQRALHHLRHVARRPACPAHRPPPLVPLPTGPRE